MERERVWTTAPTQPGYYWAFSHGNEKSDIVQLKPSGEIVNSSRPWLTQLSDYRRWIGPMGTEQAYE
jgi:hypothetical protein